MEKEKQEMIMMMIAVKIVLNECIASNWEVSQTRKIRYLWL